RAALATARVRRARSSDRGRARVRSFCGRHRAPSRYTSHARAYSRTVGGNEVRTLADRLPARRAMSRARRDRTHDRCVGGSGTVTARTGPQRTVPAHGGRKQWETPEMRWPRFSSAPRVSASGQLQAPADIAKQVDAELRRWRTSGVPVADPRAFGDLRAKTLVTIGAAMRQAQLERQRSHQKKRWRYALSAAAVLIGLGGAVYAGVGTTPSGSVSETQATLTGQSGRIWVGAAGSRDLLQQAPLGEGTTQALSVGDRVITPAGG